MYEVEIRNGLELLDEKLGRDVWLPRVNPATIRMSSCVSCVAAQATGSSYGQALITLGIVSESERDRAIENSGYPIPDDIAGRETHYGFEVVHDDHTPVKRIVTNVTALESEWQDVIAAMKFPE